MLKVLLDLAEVEAGKVSRAGALAMLSRHTDRYDPAVLTAVSRVTGTVPAVEGKPLPTPVSLKDLAVGQVLAEDVAAAGGRVLLPAGRQLTELLLEKLTNYAALAGIQEPIMVRAFPQG